MRIAPFHEGSRELGSLLRAPARSLPRAMRFVLQYHLAHREGPLHKAQFWRAESGGFTSWNDRAATRRVRGGGMTPRNSGEMVKIKPESGTPSLGRSRGRAGPGLAQCAPSGTPRSAPTVSSHSQAAASSDWHPVGRWSNRTRGGCGGEGEGFRLGSAYCNHRWLTVPTEWGCGHGVALSVTHPDGCSYRPHLSGKSRRDSQFYGLDSVHGT